MERCPVYTGLDSPCKVHGLNSKYFYRWLSISGVALVFAFLSIMEWVNSGFTSSGLLSLCVALFFCIGGPLVYYKVLYNKSHSPKLKYKHAQCTLTNRRLFKILFKNTVNNGK